eukprot:787919-Pleurochrysis_carterae.AAC.1
MQKTIEKLRSGLLEKWACDTLLGSVLAMVQTAVGISALNTHKTQMSFQPSSRSIGTNLHERLLPVAGNGLLLPLGRYAVARGVARVKSRGGEAGAVLATFGSILSEIMGFSSANSGGILPVETPKRTASAVSARCGGAGACGLGSRRASRSDAQLRTAAPDGGGVRRAAGAPQQNCTAAHAAISALLEGLAWLFKPCVALSLPTTGIPTARLMPRTMRLNGAASLRAPAMRDQAESQTAPRSAKSRSKFYSTRAKSTLGMFQRQRLQRARGLKRGVQERHQWPLLTT